MGNYYGILYLYLGLEIMDVWNSRPELLELQNQVMTIHWEALGLQLGLENDQLVAIRQQRLGNIAACRKDMFALWLKTKLNASRKQLLDALRTDSVNEVYMAQQYEKYIRHQLSQSETKGMITNQDYDTKWQIVSISVGSMFNLCIYMTIMNINIS